MRNQKEPAEFFDEAHAATYDERFAKLEPLRQALDLLMRVIVSDQGENARVLCVGAGTGTEVIHLAEFFPPWRFLVLEPSGPMLAVCQRRLEEHVFSDRCELYHGFVESLPRSQSFDVATSILVSHFIVSPDARARYFRTIAGHLKPGGCLINTDLAFDTDSPAYDSLLDVWLRMMRGAEVPPEDVAKIRAAYENDVAISPPEMVAGMIAANGFGPVVPFFRAGLIHGWFAKRTRDPVQSAVVSERD